MFSRSNPLRRSDSVFQRRSFRRRKSESQASPLRESCTDLSCRGGDGGPVNLRDRSHTNPYVETHAEATSVSSSGSTSSKWKNIFRSKAKSNQKLEKRKSSGPVYLDIYNSGLNATAQPPRAHSHECLCSDGPGANMGPYVESGPWERQRYIGPHVTPSTASYRIQKNGYVRPVHPSLVQGQEFCFAVFASDHEPVRYYASQSEEDRRRWMQALRRTAKPELANERHFENSLRLVIQEVKNVSPKKRYFCEILLDGVLNARTTSKAMSSASSDMLFWGEEFEFHNLSKVNTLTIQLRRDPSDKKGNKKAASKKTAPQFAAVSHVSGTTVVSGSTAALAYPVASVSISTSDIQRRAEVEKWYPAYPAGSAPPVDGLPDPSNPQIRIKARYLSVDVLPQRCYRALQDYLAKNTLFLLTQLESVLTVKTKEELAGTLVNIHYKIHRVDDLLSELTAQEINALGDESMVFRGNSFATKAVECYLKTTGEKYLEETLGEVVQEVMTSDQEVEVDPSALSDNRSSLDDNQRAVRQLVNNFWTRIRESQAQFPLELRHAFTAIRARLDDIGRHSDLCDQVISACIFLRYICPAILNPVLFRLVREWPSDHRISRAFTLVAKTVQALANFSQFGRKEDYMTFLNDFVKEETPRMRNFLKEISSRRPTRSGPEGDGRVHSLHREDFIDLSYELAMAHQQLSQVLPKLPQEVQSNRQITQLHSILRQLNKVSESQGPYLDPISSEKSINGNGSAYGGRGDPSESLQDVEQLLEDLNINVPDDREPVQKPKYKPKQHQQQQQLQQLQQKLQQQHHHQQQQHPPAQHHQQQQHPPAQHHQQQQHPPVQHHQQQQHPPAQHHQQQQHYQKLSQTSRQQANRQLFQQQRRQPQGAPYQQYPTPYHAPHQPPNDAQPYHPAQPPQQQQQIKVTPSGDAPSSPVRRPQRQPAFVVPRASEEVCSILSTDSESCGMASPSRSSWGGEVSGSGPPGTTPSSVSEARRGSAHSTNSALDSLASSTNGRDRRAGLGTSGGGVGGSATNVASSGVRMGTRSIQHRSVSSEKSVGDLEHEIRVLNEEMNSIRQLVNKKDEEIRLLKRHLEDKDSHIAKLNARISIQDQNTHRLQAALEEVAKTTPSPHYHHQHSYTGAAQSTPGRRYFPSSASSGSLHSLSLAASTSANDLAGSGSNSTPTAAPRKPLKQTLC